MSNFFIIAAFYSNKKLVGYRVYDYKTGNVEDYIYNDLRAKMIAGLDIANAKVNTNEIVGTNGSLTKLTKISYTTGNIGDTTPLILINKVGQHRYTLVDYSGTSRILPKKTVIEMYNKFGIANCKVRQVNGDFVISSIFGTIEQVADNTETEGVRITSCREYYLNQSKNLNISPELLELNSYMCSSLDAMGKTKEECMNIIDNNLDKDMSKDLLLNSLPVGTIYLYSDKIGIRVRGLDNTGIGAELNKGDFSSLVTIPFDLISSIKLVKVDKDYELRVRGLIVAPNKQAITEELKIRLDREKYTITYINTTITEGTYTGKRSVKKSKYARLAKLLGLKIESDRYIKILKTLTPNLWVYDIDWSPELETIADKVGFDIQPDKDYCYVLSDDIAEYTTMFIAEMPHSDYNELCLSRRFKARILTFTESDDEKTALIKLKVDNDIIIETFIKMDFLGRIEKCKQGGK